MSASRGFSASAILVSGLVITFLSLQSVRFAIAETAVTELPPISLTVVGANGTQVVLNETGVAGLSSYRGYGGYKNQVGVLKGLGNYTGVSLNILCSLVGDLTNTSIVKIMATDNYSKTFTYAEVSGEFVTFDNVTGVEVPHYQSLVPIVAFYINDANVSSSDGPLRMAVVGPEGLVTSSTYWVKQVVRIEITDEAIPEFPSLLILSLLLLIAVATTLSLKVQYPRRTI
jgi:hypothetical protein